MVAYFKNHCGLLYRFEHAQFVLILKCNIVPTVYNDYASCELCIIKDYELNVCEYFGKENRFKFAQILVDILQMFTMHNLPHRAQVMTAYLNDIPLKVRQGTVLHFRINTKFACSKR